METEYVVRNGRHSLRTTPVYETYWRFAVERQNAYLRRLAGMPAPWTDDPIISEHRFTNAYRASDRVSQYLIRLAYADKGASFQDRYVRIVLFKLFNKIETWEGLMAALAEPLTARTYNPDHLGEILGRQKAAGPIYTAAYVMPNPACGYDSKHRNHLEMLARMLRDDLPAKLERAGSLADVYRLLLAVPSLGPFLAFQLAIDLNYTPAWGFSENDHVVAGPGAVSGIRKCFADVGDLSNEDVIRVMTEVQEAELARLGLVFHRLGGSRPLQLIDCQNLFCETNKYARRAHPDQAGTDKRTTIKQRFNAPSASLRPLPRPFYPPRWKVGEEWIADLATPASAQLSLW